MIKMKYIPVEQPIGTLFFGSLSVGEIETFSKVTRREKPSDDGIQRKLDKKRLKAISMFSENSDSVFPTPIILAGKSKLIEIQSDYLVIKPIADELEKFNIVDGQHRFYGIREAENGHKYQMPVAIILNTTLEQEAHIFSVINGNQKPVSKSLIYDLFHHSNKRSFERTGHIIAQELNSDFESPFYKKLKMLGYIDKSENSLTKEETIPSLSQGIFIDILLEYISNDVRYENQLIQRGIPLEFKSNKKYIFREFYNNQEDFMIYKILKNYFNSVKSIFLYEWEKSDKYILSKSTGYMALMRLLSDLFDEAESYNFSESYFEKIFSQLKSNLPESIEFTSEQFGSSKSGAAKLYRILKEYL